VNRDTGLAVERTVIAAQRTALAVLAGVAAVARLHADDLVSVAGLLLAGSALCALVALAARGPRRTPSSPLVGGVRASFLTACAVGIGLAELMATR
jgi:uncharacterized membrane protein YidH (DUF202 family)